jgi:hypothetical protein
MRRVLLALLAMPFIASPVGASPRSDRALSKEMAGRLGKSLAPAKVKITGPLSLSISRNGKVSSTVNLDRVALFCDANSKSDCEEMKARFVAASIDVDSNPTITKSNLRLVVRSSDYVKETSLIFGAEPNKIPMSAELTEGISLLLLADFPRTARAINPDDLQTLNLKRDEAWAIGRKQMVEHLPAIPTRNALLSGLVAITDVDYAASIMLADGWDDLSASVGPELFLAVPDDNFVLVGIESNPTRVSKLKELIRDHFGRAQRGISPLVYRRVTGKWVPID